MQRLAPGQSNSVAFPAVDIWTYDSGGLLQDAILVQWAIFDVTSNTNLASPNQVIPSPSGFNTIDPVSDRISKGHWAPRFTAPTTKGRYEMEIRVTIGVGDTVMSYTQEFEVVSFSSGPDEYSYASVDDMRGEGVSPNYDDRRVFRALRQATRLIEQVTGWWFGPRYRTLTLDGQGVPYVRTSVPVIAIEQVLADIYTPDLSSIETIGYKVYNRHLLFGMLDPDDRQDGRVEITPTSALGYWPWSWASGPWADDLRLSKRFFFPRGRQNVQITGVFGYTDADGSPAGAVPDEIVWATIRLARRFLPKATHSAQIDDLERGRLPTSESTRDQSYTISDKMAIPAPYTGDPMLDAVLRRYRRPPASSVA